MIFIFKMIFAFRNKTQNAGKIFTSTIKNFKIEKII